jgi:hypothetical protein
MSHEIGISILLSAVTSDKTPEGVLTVAELARKILGLQYSRKDEQEDVVRPIEFLLSHPVPQNHTAHLTRKIQTIITLQS